MEALIQSRSGDGPFKGNNTSFLKPALHRGLPGTRMFFFLLALQLCRRRSVTGRLMAVERPLGLDLLTLTGILTQWNFCYNSTAELKDNLLLRSRVSNLVILQGLVEGPSPLAVQCISSVLCDACETAVLPSVFHLSHQEPRVSAMSAQTS